LIGLPKLNHIDYNVPSEEIPSLFLLFRNSKKLGFVKKLNMARVRTTRKWERNQQNN
jgi:hypothetical protein